MENTTKAKIRHAARMFAGFCTEDAPEAALVRIIEALLEGNEAEAEKAADEGTEWVLEWEKGQE